MNRNQKGTLERLRNVQGFLERRHITMDGAAIAPAKQQLDELLAALAAQAVNQGGAEAQARTQTAETRRLRRQLLVRHVRRVVRAADIIKLTEAEETFPTFVMPAKRLDDERLASSAAVMADLAEPHAEQFVARGFSADFVSRMRAAATALVDSRKQRGEYISRRSGATQGVHDSDVRARRIIKLLDAFVKPEVETHAVLAAEWKAAVRKPVIAARGVAGSEQETPLETAA
jgi:hypothetical protein